MIDFQGLPLSVDGSYDVLELEPLADLESLTENVNMSFSGHQANKGHLAHSDGQLSFSSAEVGWQLAQLLAASVARGSLMTQPGMDVFFVDGLHQSAQLPPDIPWPAEGLTQQQRLEPAVEILHRAITPGHTGDVSVLNMR